MNIVTWNLARPVEVRGDRLRRLASALSTRSADIWILTETVTTLSPPAGVHVHHAAAHTPGLRSVERWVTIWSRFEIVETLVTADPARHAAVRLTIPNEPDLIVCGTVLPWLGSSWGSVPARGGAAFAAAVEQQRADWQAFSMTHPGADLLIAGDFNQDFAARHYYGSRANRAALAAALHSAGARVLTGGDADPIPRHAKGHAAVDHIAIRSAHPGWLTASTDSWPCESRANRSLSDHFAVAVRRGAG